MSERWRDEFVRFWDLDRLERRPGELICHSQVNALAYSPDGKWLLSAHDQTTLLLWNVAKGTEVRSFKGHEGIIQSAVFSPDGKHVLSGSIENLFNDQAQEILGFRPRGRTVMLGGRVTVQ